MSRILYILLIVFVSSLSVFGQAFQCGYEFTEEARSILINNKKTFYQSDLRSQELKYIPIKFHLVADGSGNNRIELQEILNQLCELNNVFEPLGYKFYMKDGEVNYINSNPIFDNPSSSAATVSMSVQRNNNGANAMNVFVNKEVDGDPDSPTLAYYNNAQDWIVMKNSNAISDRYDHFVLAHEIGHYFSLPHTFNGWDGSPWSGDDVTTLSPNGILNELVDGSNCETAGDMICDTPADYNLGFGWDGCREYDGGCKDPKGELLDPDEQNFMGYFIGCDEYNFSPMQLDIINNDYNTSRRAYLRVSYIPNDAAIEDVPSNISPVDDATTQFYNGVELEWKAVPNATHYLVSLSRGLIKEQFVVKNDNKLFLTHLEADKTYRWTVQPFSEISTCTEVSQTTAFTTGTMTTSINDLNKEKSNLSIFPNPMNGNLLNLDLTDEYIGPITINIFNIAGRSVYVNNQIKRKKETVISIDDLNLSSGFYILKIELGKNSFSRKLIVND